MKKIEVIKNEKSVYVLSNSPISEDEAWQAVIDANIEEELSGGIDDRAVASQYGYLYCVVYDIEE